MYQTHSHPCMMLRNKWPADRWGLVHENRVLEHAVCIYMYISRPSVHFTWHCMVYGTVLSFSSFFIVCWWRRHISLYPVCSSILWQRMDYLVQCHTACTIACIYASIIVAPSSSRVHPTCVHRWWSVVILFLLFNAGRTQFLSLVCHGRPSCGC